MRRLYRTVRTRSASARTAAARRVRKIRDRTPNKREVRAALLATVPAAALFGFAGMQTASAAEPPVLSAPLTQVAPQNALPDPLPDRPPQAPAKAVEASYYGKDFAGRPTASGERFDPEAMTAAHRTLPFGSIVRVTNAATGKSVKVKINDRGPFHGNREIDLSAGAARAIGMIDAGTGKVMLDVVEQARAMRWKRPSPIAREGSVSLQ